MAFMHYETNQRVPDLSAHSGNSQTGDLDNQSPGALMESTHLDIIIRWLVVRTPKLKNQKRICKTSASLTFHT